MRSDLPTGAVTFLFTDVEGSTRLLHSLGAEGYAEALAEHRQVIREACRAEGGVEVDTQGDAFFFAFPSAPEAVAAAAAFTDALASGPIQVRVGVHSGTPLVTEEGYVGDDVHFGARVMSSAHGGQVVLSRATADLVDLSLSELGEHRLKDVGGAVPLYQLGETSFPPLKTISNTNLPRPASSFLGRETELAEVLSRIEAGARLVTLTGPGGTGKTRLALEAAATLVPEYKAGVFWVGLSSLRDAVLVTETIAQTLGAKDGLSEHIGEREMLLLLDNLEQVIEAAPELSQLLQACSNLALLVTSRELLRIPGEVEYPVPPLAQPEAIELFCARSQLEPGDEIAELCARLDSLPLAVELAAARTKALTPSQILERLSGRLDLLKGGRDADPRQQTLRATIEWSYDLLNPEEQQLFARLSVFAGGCTLAAAEEVCDADLDTLQSLVEKSLLRFSEGRYWMLETIREYAAEHHNNPGKAETREHHARYYTHLAEAAYAGTETAEQEQWIERLTREADNMRAAIAFLSQADDGTRVLQLAGALGFFWELGRTREGRAVLTRALERGEHAEAGIRLRALAAVGLCAYYEGDLDAATAVAQTMLSLARDHQDEVRISEALNNLGALAMERGAYDEAIRLFEQSLEQALDTGNQYAAQTLVTNLGWVALLQGRAADARGRFERSVELARRLHDVHGEATALASLGWALLEEDQRCAARDHFASALHLAQRIGARRQIAYCLSGFSALAMTGRTSAARATRLLGVHDALLCDAGVVADRYSREKNAATERDARATLPDESWTVEYTLGKGMSLDEAVEYALASID